MPITGHWTSVGVDDARCLVYGPRLGRLYLVSRIEISRPELQRVLGLGSFIWGDRLVDPAAEILHDLASLRQADGERPRWTLRAAYRLLHWSRYVINLRLAARMLGWLARRGGAAGDASVSTIGRTLHAVESAGRLRDCYPRALLTAYLCLRNGHDCDLVVGTLAPTRKMHAWCCTAGRIPFEPLPEHYMYQPLIVMRLVH